MKKSTLLLGMLTLGTVAFGQSQRLVLEEEFTQASCPPCAAQNPAFNTLLAANTAKTISIKYQTSWPGVDPMNAQNASEVASRVTYYGVNGVPDVRQDGAVIGSGQPSAITQSVINTEYAVPSPFTINVSHSFSSDYDSIFITAVITCSQNFTPTGALKGHVVLVEQEINFTSAPGTNGEMDFYSVMRKMYPNASGTTLTAGPWTVGQTQTLTFARPLPSYIYSKAQLGVVAFVQDDGPAKSVKQAAYSAPQPIAIDAGANAIAGIPLYQCTSTFTPTVTVKNFGTATLTSATINYKIDGGTVMTQAWTGSLASGATNVATLPMQTVSGGGAHTFTAYTSDPNGVPDPDAANNQTVKSFAIIGTGSAAPLTEGYQLTTFPPAGWFINNPDNGPTWTRRTGTGAGGFGTSTACAKIDFYTNAAGNVDEFYSKNLDLTGASGVNLTFDVAYAQYSTENDKIEVKVSTDCGSTWTTVYNKAGSTLATAPDASASFAPTAAQWRAETVSLASYIGQSNVMIKFVATSQYGNNAYIDNINISNLSTGIDEQDGAFDVNVYPNPMTNSATVQFTLPESNTVSIALVNALGQVVSTENLGTMNMGEQNYSLNVSSLNNGFYFLNITVGENTITRKVSINK